ncbi:MAG: GNAT family N-acetyltransferase [Candidatus Eremiobacterota bacterium]
MLQIQKLGTSPAEEAWWSAYVQAHPGATIYHDLRWRRIFESSFGYRSHYLLARLDDGRVVGALPLLEVKSPLSRRLVSVPFRDRGGPLWDTPEVFRGLLEEAVRLVSSLRASCLELKSLDPLPDHPGLRERRYWVHSVADLSGVDPERLLARLGAKTRNMLRQAERAGLAASVQPPGEGLAEWYGVYLRSQRNLGLPPLPGAFFACVLHELRDSARVLLVQQGLVPVAACILFRWRDIGMYAYSASLPEARPLRPNDAMLHRLVLWSLQTGLTRLDLGSDAPSQESLLFFKRKWLARQSTIPVYAWGKVDPAAADSSHPRYRLLRACFRKLPLPVLDYIGRVASRYFG